MNIKITTDSTADLSKDIIEKYNISIVPLQILIGDETYKDFVDIDSDNIFNIMEEKKALASTCAVNIEEYENFFKKHVENSDYLIHFSLGSKVSSCFQNANIAAGNFKNVKVIDTNSLTTGQGILAYLAAKMIKNGASFDEIIETSNNLKENVDISFVIDTLEFLKKGGRCSSLASLGANLLKIKPSIQMEDGILKTSKKYRGKLESCVELYIKDKLENNTDINFDTLFLTHSKCDKTLVDIAKSTIKKFANFKEIIETNAGCTISSHCGPNCLGIIFMKK